MNLDKLRLALEHAEALQGLMNEIPKKNWDRKLEYIINRLRGYLAEEESTRLEEFKKFSV